MGAEREKKPFKKNFVGGRARSKRVDTFSPSTVAPYGQEREERERQILALQAEKNNLTLSPKRRNRAAAKLARLIGRKD